MGEVWWASREDTWFCACIYIRRAAVASRRRRIVVVVVFILPLPLPLAHTRSTRHSFIPLFFFLFRLLARESAFWLGLVSHAHRGQARSQHRPIRPLSSSIYLLVFPIHLANERGEPDLSPLNGINKLYYACTSP